MQRNILKKVFLLIILGTGLIVLSSKLRGSYEIPDLLNAQERDQHFSPVNPFSPSQNVVSMPNEKLKTIFPVNPFSLGQNVTPVPNEKLNRETTMLNFRAFDQRISTEHSKDLTQSGQQKPEQQTNPPAHQTNPPPKQKNPPPKQTNPPPKQTNPPPKQKNPSLKQKKSTGAAQSNLHLRKDLFTANCLPTPPFPPPPRVPQEGSNYSAMF